MPSRPERLHRAGLGGAGIGGEGGGSPRSPQSSLHRRKGSGGGSPFLARPDSTEGVRAGPRYGYCTVAGGAVKFYVVWVSPGA